MSPIKVQLFGTPAVYADGAKVFFPFRKAEALFYYLVVNRQASRDELVNILWGELTEETARKNLRNALYKIKKAFNADVLVSPRKAVIMLNPALDLETDLAQFSGRGKTDLEVYQGPFLQGFLVRDGDAFEEWMLQKRNQYQERYVKLLYEEIKARNCAQLSVDEPALRLIEVDEFDEKAYRILMRHYADTGSYNKALELYERLCSILERELGVQPEEQTAALHLEILHKRDLVAKLVKAEREAFFFGRQQELNRLCRAFNDFLETGQSMAVLILGEAGIGKTRLKEVFFNNLRTDFCLLEANCYQAEEEFLLKPWHPIFSRLVTLVKEVELTLPVAWVSSIAAFFPSFALASAGQPEMETKEPGHYDYQYAIDAILSILALISKNRTLILALEDLQWMDTVSRNLLKNILLNRDLKLFFIGTSRSGYGTGTEGWLSPLAKEDRLERVELQRFSLEEVGEFATRYLSELKLTQQQVRKIFDDTEGNTFFLIEYLNSVRDKGRLGAMSHKALDILKSRFVDVSQDGMKLLNLLSLFFHRVPVDILLAVTGKDRQEIMEALEELELKGIIRETANPGKVSVEFTHQKLREFIYNQQPVFKRRQLHEKVALVLERNLRDEHRDILLYSKLIYHFSEAGNTAKTLKYRLKNLNLYLDYCHELFPTVIDFSGKPEKTFIVSNDQLLKYFREIESLLANLDAAGDDLQILEDRMSFLYLKGRHLIRQGDYKEGTRLIGELARLAGERDNRELIIKANLQLIYYCIQTHRVADMKHYLGVVTQVNENDQASETTGILLRLNGLCHLMSGELTNAEELFNQSIRFFSEANITREKYALNIAACYNYLGEIRRYGKEFAKALNCYDKALGISEEKKVFRSYSFFNTCAGQAALGLGDHARAFHYLKRAIKHYEQSDLIWRRSVAEAYLALLSVTEGGYNEAYRYLESAEKFADKMQNPYESGLIYLVKAQIRAKMHGNPELSAVFHQKLDKDLAFYCRQGLEVLEQVPYCYESKILKELALEGGIGLK
jgi:DNA-binding SARP family transcriptional activator